MFFETRAKCVGPILEPDNNNENNNKWKYLSSGMILYYTLFEHFTENSANIP